MSKKPFSAPIHTQFSNDAIDYIMPRVSANAWRILTVVIRKTYGWRKNKDRISLSQFEKLTGIKSRPTTLNALAECIELGVLIRRKKGNSFEYELNRNYVLEESNRFRNQTTNGLENKPIKAEIDLETKHTKENIKETIKEATTTHEKPENSPSKEKAQEQPEINIFALYEQNIGVITAMTADILRDAETDYPAEWIRDAIKIAVKRNARNWAFVSAILRRWESDGKDNGLENSKKPKKAHYQTAAEKADAVRQALKDYVPDDEEDVIDV